jgi:glycosyltransferase involved in cell wall biosynthesis
MAYNFNDLETHSLPMQDDTGSPLRFDIDRLVVSGRRVFGWGWVADADRIIHDVHLLLEGAAWRKRLPASFGMARKDVAQAFPDLVAGGSSGFVITGYVPDGSVTMVSLEVAFEGGDTATIRLGNIADVRARDRTKRRTLGRIARSAWRRVKSGDFTGLLSRRGSRVGISSADDKKVMQGIVRAAGATGRVRIIFDHDMGGGANHYRRKLTSRWTAAGDAVLLCTYHLAALEYRFRLAIPGKAQREFRASSFLALEAVLGQAPVAELFVNSPVSFEDPLVLADWLARMRESYPKTRLTVSAHDYFAVCPSFVLLNAEGRFCGIPDIAECERCLPRHEAPHVALSPPAEIHSWRAAWRRCLEGADEVRCFSESARQLLARAYPSVGRDKMSLVPHEVEFVPARLPAIDRAGTPVIGVLGTISEQKGASIVTGIVARLDRDKREARVVVVGTLDAACASRRLAVTGPYEPGELPALVEKHGINIFLFPSIWPETFSYVVAEMMALGLPIVAFDLGAPAERLRGYRLARLCSAADAQTALDTLLAFHAELAGRASRAA